jgi:hypothetical protein
MKTLRPSESCPSFLDEAPPASPPLHGALGDHPSPEDKRIIPLKNCQPGEAETIKRYLALLEEMERKKARNAFNHR